MFKRIIPGKWQDRWHGDEQDKNHEETARRLAEHSQSNWPQSGENSASTKKRDYPLVSSRKSPKKAKCDDDDEDYE